MEERTIIDPNMPPAPAGAPAPPPMMGEATQVIAPGAAPAGYGYGDRTQQALTTTCPVCGTPNGPSERYCQDCGLMFGSAAGEIEPLPDAANLPRLVDAASGRELLLNPGVNSVGREAADVLLPDPTVSRRHAQLTLENGSVVVEDLGSTNGTSVGGRRLGAGERIPAYTGDTVKFGNVMLTLTLPGGEARPPGEPGEAAAAPVAAAPVDRGEPIAFVALADGTEFPLYEGVNVLGRRSTSQIVLADAFASGKHAEIMVNADGTAQVVDAGSTNGTFIEGERLAANSPVALTNGMTVTMGKTPLTFRLAAPTAETPESQPSLMAADENGLTDFDLPAVSADAAPTPPPGEPGTPEHPNTLYGTEGRR